MFDGLNLVRRIFEARGGLGGPSFVSSSLQSLQRCLEDLTPSHALIVWDSQNRTWRHDLDERYKANRPPTPADLLAERGNLESAFKQSGVKSLEVSGFEADDVLATMALKVVNANIDAVIVSTDKMFYPLMSSGVKIFHQFDRRLIERHEVEQSYGLKIEQLTDYWALSGDNSNNIKGVPGVGKKTATQLLQDYGSISGIIEQDGSKKVIEHSEQAYLCFDLVQLKVDVELGANLKDFRLS